MLTTGRSGKLSLELIALAISLITVIFIPGTVLLAVGTSYGTLFSLIILAVPIGLILLGYFLLKEHPWLRVIMMGLVWYLLSQMWRYIQTWTGSATAAYATVIHTIANLIGWVEIVVAVFFFINLLQALFSFTTGHTGDRTDVKGVANWVANKVGNRARRKKTALLNSYIEEERELKLLDSAVEAKELALDEVNKIIRAGEVTDVAQKDALVAAVKQVQTKLDDARREFRLVKGRTWRSQTKFTNLVKEFKDKEKDVKQLDVLEKEVLKKHEEAITALDGALGKVSDLVRNVELVGKSVTAYPFPLNGPIANQRVKIKLVGLKTGLVALDVKTAEDAQKEAIQAVQGIVTEARELMKVNW